MKKYELIPSDKEGLYRIKALRDFDDVMKGFIGGYIESEHNLSHDGNCWVYDDAVVRDNAQVYGNAQIYHEAIVEGNAVVCDNVQIYDIAVMGNARVEDNARIWGHAVIQDNAIVCGNAHICGYAVISDDKDYIIFKNWWSSGRFFTWTRSNNMWRVGCFYGSGEELITKAYEDSEESGREYERIVKYVESILNS